MGEAVVQKVQLLEDRSHVASGGALRAVELGSDLGVGAAHLVLEATRGTSDAFGDLAGADWNWFGDIIGYLIVTTVSYAAGLGLVTGGHAVAQRRVRRVADVSVA